MQAPDWFYRLAYRHGIKLARVWWWVKRPRTSGAHLLVWCESQMLLLRSSYRAGWTTPGGAIKQGESPVEAGVREAFEEVGLRLRHADLHLVSIVEHSPDYRQDRLHLFEVQLSMWPAIKVDNREIVEARFVTLREAQSMPLALPLQEYLINKAATANGATAP